jgi:CO dehydrogenase maturation factor
MEHLSRRTTENIDELFIISDHSVKGVRTAARIIELINELKLSVGRQSVIINRVPQTMDNHVIQELEQLNIKPLATIPLDDEILKYDLEKISLLDLPDSSEAVKAVDQFMNAVLDK